MSSLGEPLLQLNPLDEGPLRHSSLFEKHAAGSEVNVLIGLSRLGFKTSLMANLGKDEFSKFILAALESEHVGVEGVKQIEGKNCGVYFVQRNYPIAGKSDVIYYRSDSAAKLLSPEDVNESTIGSSKILHLSGITPALSNSCREATFRALAIAREKGVKVSFDTNYRRKLWRSEDARPVLAELAAKSNILFIDPEDSRVIFDKHVEDPNKLIDELRDLGPETVVLKLGAKRGMVAKSSKQQATSIPMMVPVVDSIGAGDGAVAGFLAGYLGKETLQKSLDMASCCAALAVMRRGDYENLPDRAYLERWLSTKEGFEYDPR